MATKRRVGTTMVIVASLLLTSGWLSTLASASRGGRGYAGRSGDAGESRSPVAVAQPPNSLPGIDVSHYQGTIDWTSVAASGVRFAIAKASEGASFADPMYATNKAGAAAAGITFGAYHFARPDLHPNNPIGEADHFVEAAQLGPGNLIPVLDLERSGNLSPTELTDWVLQWLDRVTSLTGVRSMVYTSPNGWNARTNDTTAVADAGYTVLWVAHWNVPSPTVPANNWQGNGWTFWQYSDCGHVSGIKGCVDVDWYGGLDLSPVEFPSPDTGAPVATLTPPSGVAKPLTASFSEIVRQVTTSNVVLQELDTGAAVPSTLTCRSSKRDQVDCTAGNVVTAKLVPLDPLVSGQTYEAVVNPSGVTPAVVDRSGNPAAATQAEFSMPSEVEQGSEAIRYAWRSVPAQKAYGHSYVVEHEAGASGSFTFTGSSVTWFTVTGRAQGKASVSIDGHSHGVFNQYADSGHYKVGRSFKGLGGGEHTITIHVLGTKGSTHGTDAQVAIDAFQPGSSVVASPTLTASWATQTVTQATDGSVARTDLAGSEATFRFAGTGVDWRTIEGPKQGRAQIFVDGALLRTVDNFAAATAAVVRSVDGLVDGVHEVRIVVLGTSRPASGGTNISIDGYTVVP